jgi:hypothetical protein
MPRSHITGSCGSSIFSFLGNLHSAFHNGCTYLHFHQQCVRVPVLPHPYQHFWALPLNVTILIGVRLNLSVVLICNSFISREVEHFPFIYWPFVPLSLRIPCLIHVLIFWELSFLSSLYILDFRSLSDEELAKIFFTFCGQSLKCSDCFFCCAKAF